MVHAIRVHKHGGPEEMKWDTVELPPPGPGEAQVAHEAVGLNYIDVYHRTGLYPGALPHGVGMEGAGIVRAVGSDVADLKPGDRVAYAGGSPGAYAEARNIPAHRLVKLPASIDFHTAAGMMLKGMTAQYLLHRTYKVQKGDTILVHAAAGGVGLILCQWAKHLGATVIGTVGDETKAALAKQYGCDHPVIYSREDFAARVKEITGGTGVAVAYDAVGKDTFDKSVASLRPLGMMALYGQASGPVPPIDIGILAAKSTFLTRPGLFTYTAHRADLVATAEGLFDAVAKGAVKIEIKQTYKLADAARAHRDLEGRRTTGSTVFLP